MTGQTVLANSTGNQEIIQRESQIMHITMLSAVKALQVAGGHTSSHRYITKPQCRQNDKMHS